MLIDKNKGFAFIHIPKTGGNSVIKMLNLEKPTNILLIHEPIDRTAEDLSNLFTFAFVRNPFDRLYSTYTYYQKHEDIHRRLPIYKSNGLHHFYTGSFKHWLLHESWPLWDPNKTMGLPFQKKQQLEYITVGWQIYIDYVGRVEHFDADFRAICFKINTQPPSTIQHKNQSKRTRDYHTMYDNEMIDFVNKFHAADLDIFNYTY